jgi:hypothetical protein
MPRPPRQPTRGNVPAEELEAYDAVIDRVSKRYGIAETQEGEFLDAGGYFGPMLSSPPMCHLVSQMGAFMVTRGDQPGSYSHADREFAEQVLCATWKVNIGLNFHLVDAVGAGVRLEAIEALRYGHEERLNDDERLMTSYIRQVIDGRTADDTYAAMEKRLGTRGLMEYTALILWLQWTIRMEQWVDFPAATDAELDQLIEGLRTGQVTGEDYISRIA